MTDIAQKVRKNIDRITNAYFLDDTALQISDTKINNMNIAMLALAYLMRKNVLLVGEPGFGKTTAAAITGCIGSGLPVDLYRSVMIRCHPEQSEEKMIGRPDYGELNIGRERAVWQKSLFFPVIILDEFNRLPEGKQSEWLDSIETGRFSYLNNNFEGDYSILATINHHDQGNHELLPPALDRFHLSLEFSFPGALYGATVESYKRNTASELIDKELTSKLLSIINEKESVENRQKKIGTILKQVKVKGKELSILTNEEIKAAQAEISQIELDQDAELFLNCIISELNSTARYGCKRSSDPIDDSTHGRELASYNVINALSPRGFNESIKDFARSLAWYNNARKVSKQSIEALAPFALAHRLKFSDDFRSKHTEDFRTESFENHLAQEIVKIVRKHFENNYNNFLIFEQHINLCRQDKNPSVMMRDNFRRLEELCSATHLDHPLLREYAENIKRFYPLKKHVK